MQFNIETINREKLLWKIILLLILAVSVFFGVKYFSQKKDIEKLTQAVQAQKTNAKVVIFLELFIEKVLKTDEEITFENRLKLENAVRDINDPEILSKWEKFVAGSNEIQIQQGVKDLLEALVKKITY